MENPDEQEDNCTTTQKFQKSFEDSKAFGRKQESESPAMSHKTNSISSAGSRQGDTKSIHSDSPKPRGEFGNHCEFFLTSLGLAVGLGNLWRFPYVCYENGGGTFLIPYLLVLLLLGLPLFFSEMALGQYTGASCTITYRRMAPILRGLGYAMLSITVVINMYYTVIMAWAFQYMFEGFRSELPWSRCNPDYGTINCFSNTEQGECTSNQTFWNFTCTDKQIFCGVNLNASYSFDTDSCIDAEQNINLTVRDAVPRVASTEEYFTGYILGLDMNGEVGVTNTWERYGAPQWKMIGCLALSWLMIALSLIKGMESYGKLSYFVTLFPYVVLTTFLIYIAQEDGFTDGVKFYTTPNWEKIGEFNVWINACVQIFYSLGVSVGSQLLLSSYNGFNNNCHRDAWMIGLGNSITSVYAGFVVFGTLGMVAYKNGQKVEDVVTSGTGLAFISYPEALTIMNPGPAFSFFFFLMLCLLAMSSISGSWEPVVAAVFDDFPKLREKKQLVYLSACLIGFLGGISCCFPSGYFMFNLLNDRISNAVLYMALVEMVFLCWVYGVRRFMDNIDEMRVWMPLPLKFFWMFAWAILTPILILVIIIASLIDRVPDSITYMRKEKYEYPGGIQALAWMVELFPPALAMVFATYVFITTIRNKESVKALFVPNHKWGARPDRPKDSSGEDNRGYSPETSKDMEKRTEL